MKKLLAIIVLGLLLSVNAYAGCIKGDCKNGFGKYQDKHKSIYVGNFKNKKFHGQGIYTWSDKTKYKGDFKNGLRDGKGIFVIPNGLEFYGNFKNDQAHEDDNCEPLGIYGALKYGSEKIVIAYNQVFDLPYTIIRPSMFIITNQRSICIGAECCFSCT